MAKDVSVPKRFNSFFWDIDIEDLDIGQHKIFIIERLLNEGDHHTLRWLFDVFQESELKEAVSTSRNLTLMTARCWQTYFGLKEEEMRCFGTLLIIEDNPF